LEIYNVSYYSENKIENNLDIDISQNSNRDN